MTGATVAALELRPRLRRAAAALGYLAAGVGFGLVGLALGLAVLLSALLALAWIGLPLLALATRACWSLAEVERRQANRLLGARLAPLPPRPPDGAGLRAVADRRLWRIVGLCLLRLPTTLAGLVVGLAPFVLLVACAYLGIRGIGGFGGTLEVGPATLGPALGAGLALLTLPCAVLTIAGLEGVRAALRALVRSLLATRLLADTPVREMLAESLGDRTLSLAYWLPDRGAFVDESGAVVELPDPSTGRAWTAVELEGRRVAAIIHDVSLAAGPELVHAAVAGATLAIDNERLKADLRARVEELRHSRARVVEAADAARRRIERDLHDGAQQQLVSLALELRLLRNRIDDANLATMADGLLDKAGAALEDLRELARGIHPAILTERGLGPAVQALADRASLPVDCRVEVEERLPPAVEAAAYFLVAEALTNVVKYARARAVAIAIGCDDGVLAVEVSDDGVGGADVAAGSGLRGLSDRIGAVDGALTVASPAGGGTRVRAEIPVPGHRAVRVPGTGVGATR